MGPIASHPIRRRPTGALSGLWLAVGLTAAVLGAGCRGKVEEHHGSALPPHPPAPENTVTLVADVWPPFNNAPEDSLQGYMIDIAREALEPHGYHVRYLVVPWERALTGTREGLFDGAVAPSHDEGPDFVFPALELARNRASFFVAVGALWRFASPASLDDVCLGVAQGYDYTPWLNDYIDAHRREPARVQALTGDSPLERNIRKLLAGRIDVIVDNESTVIYTARRMGVLDRLQLAGSSPGESYCYIGLTPTSARSRVLADLLDAGLADMRRTGRLAEILDEYGLSDWSVPPRDGDE